jgi:hypothetical protein
MAVFKNAYRCPLCKYRSDFFLTEKNLSERGVNLISCWNCGQDIAARWRIRLELEVGELLFSSSVQNVIVMDWPYPSDALPEDEETND